VAVGVMAAAAMVGLWVGWVEALPPAASAAVGVVATAGLVAAAAVGVAAAAAAGLAAAAVGGVAAGPIAAAAISGLLGWVWVVAAVIMHETVSS